MNKIIFVSCLLFSSFVIKSQTLDSPNLCYVTIANDNYAHLFWTYPDTSKIDGFIIKRIILDGSGAVYGTLNNVAIIDKINLEYTDTSTSYFTTAKPYERSESYSVSAYKKTSPTTIVYSNMTLVQKTIFLSSTYDSCNNKLTLKWTKYINNNVQKYIVLYGTDKNNLSKTKDLTNNDTIFETSSLERNLTYYFVIKAVLPCNALCYCDSSSSNIVSVFTKATKVPEKITNVYVSAEKDNILEILFEAANYQNVKKFTLYKNGVELADLSNNLHFSETTNTNILNYYMVKSFDLCNQIVTQSLSSHNSILKCTATNNNFELSWDTLTIYEQLPDKQIIWANINDTWIQVKEISGNIGFYDLKYQDVFEGLSNIDNVETIKFRVEGITDTVSSYTNTVEVSVAGFFSIPNAVNPNSTVAENALFIIKAKFIKSFTIIIFDQNGAIIFKSSDLNNSWDGRYANGKTVPRAAYVYSITYTDNQGNQKHFNGIVNVVY